MIIRLRQFTKMSYPLISFYLLIVKLCIFMAHPTNPVEGCADANPKTMLPNDT